MRPREHRAPRLPELCGLEPSSGANLGLSARCVGGAEQSRPGTEGTSGSLRRCRKTAGRRQDEAAAPGPAVRTDGAAAPGPAMASPPLRPGSQEAGHHIHTHRRWQVPGGPPSMGAGSGLWSPGGSAGRAVCPSPQEPCSGVLTTRSLRRDPGRTARPPNTSFCNAATL